MISTDATWHRINGVGNSHDQCLKYLGEISVCKTGLPQKELHFYPVVGMEREELLLGEHWSKEK